jgi:hypothetical protein
LVPCISGSSTTSRICTGAFLWKRGSCSSARRLDASEVQAGWHEGRPGAVMRVESHQVPVQVASCSRVRTCRWIGSRSRNYFRRGFLFWLLELSPPNRFAFAATRFRYRWTILAPEAPAIRLVVASSAASIFSRTIRSAPDRASLPPRISFFIRSATTPFASAGSIIKEVNIRASDRRGLKRGNW